MKRIEGEDEYVEINEIKSDDYIFIPNIDSPYNDKFRYKYYKLLKQDNKINLTLINEMKTIAKNNSNIVCFNLDGWFKTKMNTYNKLQKSNGNGLFVKKKVESKIERNIFQTWKRKHIKNRALLRYKYSWKKLNRNFNYTLYDDNDCEQFVKTEFPEYYDDYMHLSIPVEKADIFRYMVTYKYGGFYSDIDASCKKTIQKLYDNFKDKTFICGRESYDLTESQRIQNKFVYRNQICNWSFAASKNHELMLLIIKETIRRIRKTPFLHTLEKTGPGVFSYCIYKYVAENKINDVIILPCCFFASNYRHFKATQYERNNIYVSHHFLGSWK